MNANTRAYTPSVVEPVASYASYADAENAVNLLADRGQAEGRGIVAGELRFVERVTERRSYGAAAGDAAAMAGATGAIVGFLLGYFNLTAPLSAAFALALWGLLFGTAVGALVGLLVHALGGRQRDFSSVRTLEAGRYDVLAPPAVAGEARRLLAETSGRRATSGSAAARRP